MGGMFQYFDFNQGSTSRDLFGHKKHNDGLEAPRNSLEFLAKSSQAYHTHHDDIPVKRKSSESNSDMLNRMQIRRYAPGVVARLMGMDSSLSSNGNLSFPSENKKPISSPCDISLRSLARRHPQEELLQKFKKEFRAWQASKSVDRNVILLEDNQRQAQENLNQLKMVRYTKSRIHRSTRKEMLDDQQGDAFLQCKVHTSKQFQSSVGKEMKCSRDEYLAATENENNEKEGNMKNFLREVKEKLRVEIQGNTRNSSTARAIYNEASLRENSNDTRNIGRHFAKQIKKSATREIEPSALDLSEFISNDARKIINDRLKNVMKNRANVRNSVKQMTELSKTATKSRNREEKRTVNESKTRSFGHAHIDKKQEISEQSSPKVLKRKKDGFSIKGKVSNLKQNLVLKSRFFTKKKPASRIVIKSLNPIFAEPSVIMNFGVVQDNHTEVPPSPVSPLEAPFTEFCSEISEQQTSYEDEQVESRDIQSTLSDWNEKMEGKCSRSGREIGIKHSLLFDLMNEMINSCKVPQLEMKTNTGNSLRSMVAFELKLTSWLSSSHEVVDFVGREMELFIFDELIDEFVCELFL